MMEEKNSWIELYSMLRWITAECARVGAHAPIHKILLVLPVLRSDICRTYNNNDTHLTLGKQIR
jgi:hypothetical protein